VEELRQVSTSEGGISRRCRTGAMGLRSQGRPDSGKVGGLTPEAVQWESSVGQAPHGIETTSEALR